MNFLLAKKTLLLLVTSSLLAGCGTMPNWISASGPSREQVQNKHDTGRIEGIQLIDVDNKLAKKLSNNKKPLAFTEIFNSNQAYNYKLNAGDIIEISIWEAPPAMLFGSIALESRAATTNAITFPEQMIPLDGQITMPFAGYIKVTGRTTREIEAEIAKRLKGKANHPQVLVRVIKNNTANATLVGDINQNMLLPLTPKGERLLDALAAGGGTKQATSRMSIQLSRQGTSASMPLDSIIHNPQQNILLQPGDVVTALFQPQSFSVLGLTGKNEEIPFEAQGITLAQALARSGGLNDSRSDARGIFIFRFEDNSLLDNPSQISAEVEENITPVIYQVDLRDPASFFVAQNFPIQNHDVIYVASSPEAEFTKFLRLIISVASPAATINRVLGD